MRLSFSEHALELQSWKTEQEMLDFLAKCDVGNIVIGSDSEQKINFYSVLVLFGCSGKSRFGIGICSEGHGLLPQLLLQPDREVLIFGFNSELVGISIKDRRCCFRILFDSLFYSLVYLHQKKIILAFHEIGVVAINKDGEELWRYAKDIIVDCAIEGERLFLKFMDSPEIVLNILNGRRINKS